MFPMQYGPWGDLDGIRVRFAQNKLGGQLRGAVATEVRVPSARSRSRLGGLGERRKLLQRGASAF